MADDPKADLVAALQALLTVTRGVSNQSNGVAQLGFANAFTEENFVKYSALQKELLEKFDEALAAILKVGQ